ncbi:MAG: hypothetical protein NVS3B19_13840 [Ginsengibacter sp.]
MQIKDVISSGILEQFVLGTASPEEIKIVEEHISHPEIQAELNNISEALETYAQAYATDPSNSVRKNILSKIHSQQLTETINKVDEEPIGKVYKMNTFLKYAVAASLILLIGSVIINFSLYNKYKKSTQEFAETRQELNNQKQVAIDMDKEISLVKNKMAVPVVLNGTPHSPESLAKIFWMKDSGAVYVDPSNLPRIPLDKQYQLWAIVDGKPVDAGMISSKNNDIFHFQKMKSFGKAQAFAITVEKAGGSTAPTMTEMVVMAKI